MNDSELIALYISGDEESLEILLERHIQNIYSVCFRVCLNEQDAHDISQNVLIKIIRYLPKFKNESSFSSWYFRIAYNESISFLNKKTNNSDITALEEILPSDQDIHEDIKNISTSEEITRIINALPLYDRAIILAYYYDDYKIKEIADMMNLNENTVKTRLSRAKKTLSPKLSHYEKNN